MATEERTSINRVSSRRLWFGFVTTAVAWVSLGCIDIVINWRACMRQEDYGIPPAHPEGRILIGVISALLLVLSILAGITSFRNWQRLSLQPLLESQAVERHQFLAYGGILISVTLGVGIVLLGITPFFLDMCWRAR